MPLESQHSQDSLQDPGPQCFHARLTGSRGVEAGERSPQAQGRYLRCWPGSPAQQPLPTITPVLRLNQVPSHL